MFGLEFSWIDWTVLGASMVAFFATIKSILTAVRLGSQTVKSFATSKIENAQTSLNNKIDTVQNALEQKLNTLEAELIKKDQQIEAIKQQFIDYQNSVRSILDNA